MPFYSSGQPTFREEFGNQYSRHHRQRDIEQLYLHHRVGQQRQALAAGHRAGTIAAVVLSVELDPTPLTLQSVTK